MAEGFYVGGGGGAGLLQPWEGKGDLFSRRFGEGERCMGVFWGILWCLFFVKMGGGSRWHNGMGVGKGGDIIYHIPRSTHINASLVIKQMSILSYYSLADGHGLVGVEMGYLDIIPDFLRYSAHAMAWSIYTSDPIFLSVESHVDIHRLLQ